VSNFGALELLLMVLSIALYVGVWVVPFWFIFRKAGMPPALSLLMLIPVINLVVVYVLAFSDWPALRQRPDQTSLTGT
jgi:hypothetical protein